MSHQSYVMAVKGDAHCWIFTEEPKETMKHIVDTCPSMKFDGGLTRLMMR